MMMITGNGMLYGGLQVAFFLSAFFFSFGGVTVIMLAYCFMTMARTGLLQTHGGHEESRKLFIVRDDKDNFWNRNV